MKTNSTSAFPFRRPFALRPTIWFSSTPSVAPLLRGHRDRNAAAAEAGQPPEEVAGHEMVRVGDHAHPERLAGGHRIRQRKPRDGGRGSGGAGRRAPAPPP